MPPNPILGRWVMERGRGVVRRSWSLRLLNIMVHANPLNRSVPLSSRHLPTSHIHLHAESPIGATPHMVMENFVLNIFDPPRL